MRRIVSVVVGLTVALALPASTLAYRAYVGIGARDAPALWAFDTASNRLVGSPLFTRNGPIGPLAIAPSGQSLYVVVHQRRAPARPELTASTLEVLNTATKRVSSRRLNLPGVAQWMAVSGRLVYVAADFVFPPNGGESTRVYVIDARTDRVRRTISFGPSTLPVDLIAAPDGRRVYFLDAGQRRLWVIDGRRARILTTLGLPPPNQGQQKMVITPNGRYLYVPTFSGLAVISTARKHVVRTIPLPGGGPGTLAMAPSGLTIYLAYTNTGLPPYTGPPAIVRLSTTTNRIVGAPVPLPIAMVDPHESIAVTPDGRSLYVTASARAYGSLNPGSSVLEIHRIYAISTASNVIRKTVRVSDRILRIGTPVNGVPTTPPQLLDPDSIVFLPQRSAAGRGR